MNENKLYNLYNTLGDLSFKGVVDDGRIKELEAKFFTEDNFNKMYVQSDTDLERIKNGENINKIINNENQLSDYTLILIYSKFISNDNFEIFLQKDVNHKDANHYVTTDNLKNVIFNSGTDGRQVGNCCGIHAIEGVLIAEELGKDVYNFKETLIPTSEEELLNQRKILFKMEILAAIEMKKESKLKEEEKKELDELYGLYFEEFKARCAAYQEVKKEIQQKEQNNEKTIVVNDQGTQTLEEMLTPEADTIESSGESFDSQNSTHAPRYKLKDRKNKKDTELETYDINNKRLDIEQKSVELYIKFLKEVIEEIKNEENILEITKDEIVDKVTNKLNACFSIKDENGLVDENKYSEEDRKNIEIAKSDYKATAEESSEVKKCFEIFENKKTLKQINGAIEEIDKIEKRVVEFGVSN